MSLDEKKIDLGLAGKVTDELISAVKAKYVDGKVTCPELLTIAEETGASRQVVGAAADVARIKVHQCELGCF